MVPIDHSTMEKAALAEFALMVSDEPEDRVFRLAFRNQSSAKATPAEHLENAQTAYELLRKSFYERESAQKIQDVLLSELKASGHQLQDLDPANVAKPGSGKSSTAIREDIESRVKHADWNIAQHLYVWAKDPSPTKKTVMSIEKYAGLETIQEHLKNAGKKLTDLEPGKSEEDIARTVLHGFNVVPARDRGINITAATKLYNSVYYNLAKQDSFNDTVYYSGSYEERLKMAVGYLREADADLTAIRPIKSREEDFVVINENLRKNGSTLTFEQIIEQEKQAFLKAELAAIRKANVGISPPVNMEASDVPTPNGGGIPKELKR